MFGFQQLPRKLNGLEALQCLYHFLIVISHPTPHKPFQLASRTLDRYTEHS